MKSTDIIVGREYRHSMFAETVTYLGCIGQDKQKFLVITESKYPEDVGKTVIPDIHQDWWDGFSLIEIETEVLFKDLPLGAEFEYNNFKMKKNIPMSWNAETLTTNEKIFVDPCAFVIVKS